MKMSPQCPGSSKAPGRYYCQILQAERNSGDEEICSFCPELQQELRHPAFWRAFCFAAEAHKGQFRKKTDIPYLIHLVRTWDYVRRMTEDGEERIAALLHDVLEDTAVTADELRDQFGDRVTRLVADESEYKREEKPAGETWRLRKSETIAKLRRKSESDQRAAMRIAFADKLANLYSMAYEYRRVGDRLWEKFNQKDKQMHGWYYGEMGDIFAVYFTDEAGRALVEEYKKYYREVFENEISL